MKSRAGYDFERNALSLLFPVSTPRPHQNKLGSHDLTPVIDTYEHALFAMYPRARYVVGKGMKQVGF